MVDDQPKASLLLGWVFVEELRLVSCLIGILRLLQGPQVLRRRLCNVLREGRLYRFLVLFVRGAHLNACLQEAVDALASQRANTISLPLSAIVCLMASVLARLLNVPLFDELTHFAA